MPIKHLYLFCQGVVKPGYFIVRRRGRNEKDGKFQVYPMDDNAMITARKGLSKKIRKKVLSLA